MKSFLLVLGVLSFMLVMFGFDSGAYAMDRDTWWFQNTLQVKKVQVSQNEIKDSSHAVQIDSIKIEPNSDAKKTDSEKYDEKIEEFINRQRNSVFKFYKL